MNKLNQRDLQCLATLALAAAGEYEIEKTDAARELYRRLAAKCDEQARMRDEEFLAEVDTIPSVDYTGIN